MLLWTHSTLGQLGPQMSLKSDRRLHLSSLLSLMVSLETIWIWRYLPPGRVSEIRIFTVLHRMTSLELGWHSPSAVLVPSRWALKSWAALENQIGVAEINDWSWHTVRPRISAWPMSFSFTNGLDSKLNLSGCWRFYSICLGAVTGASVLGHDTWGEYLGERWSWRWWLNYVTGAGPPFKEEGLWLQGRGLIAPTGF